MVSAWAYREGEQGSRPVDPAAVATAVRTPATLLWVDAADPTDAELEALADGLGLNPLAVEDVAHGQQRTKLERWGSHFHIAARDCTLVDHHVDAREIDILFGEGWILTIHRTTTAEGATTRDTRPGGADDAEGPTPSDRAHGPGATDAVGRATRGASGAGLIAEARHRYERQREERDSNDEGFVLWAVLDVIVDRYFEVVDSLDDRLEGLEEIVFEGRSGGATPREVFALRRSMVTFRRAAAPLREVIAQMLRREVEVVGDAALMHLQDVFDHVLRVADLVESQRDVLTGLLEAHLAVASNRMNEVMKLMSSWGAIVLGATLIAGIYGMNFRHMPELDWRFGYPLALGMMAVLTVVLYRMFRRRNWL